MSRPGAVLAAALREEAQDIQSGLGPCIAYTCRSCETRPAVEDGYCDPCLGRDSWDEARSREAIRQLHRDTAFLLRRLGFAERAQVHDREAER